MSFDNKNDLLIILITEILSDPAALTRLQICTTKLSKILVKTLFQDSSESKGTGTCVILIECVKCVSSTRCNKKDNWDMERSFALRISPRYGK